MGLGGGGSNDNGAHQLLAPLAAASPPLSLLRLVPTKLLVQVHCKEGSLQRGKGGLHPLFIRT